jgi:hypothetical protein
MFTVASLTEQNSHGAHVDVQLFGRLKPYLHSAKWFCGKDTVETQSLGFKCHVYCGGLTQQNSHTGAHVRSWLKSRYWFNLSLSVMTSGVSVGAFCNI